MYKFILLFFFVVVSVSSTSLLGQQLIIKDGTYSNRGTNTYYPMAGFDTSPYEEYYLVKNNGFRMNFRMLRPNNYDPQNTAKKYPLILMFHGKGEGGALKGTTDITYRNNDLNLLWGGKEHLEAVNKDPSDSRSFPGFVVFPQNEDPRGEWKAGLIEPVIEIVETLLRDYNIDPYRIYIHGLSKGADGGVWNFVKERPDLVAAMLPMSGVPGYLPPADGVPIESNQYDFRLVEHIPTWLFQGDVDNNPPLHKANNTINIFRNIGGTPRYTVYEKTGHTTWNKAYAEPDFFSWMLGYSKLSIHVSYGKNEFCPEDNVNAKLGITPGPGYNYEWSRDDVLLPNSNSNEIIATDYGYYKVRFEHPIRGWTSWSDSVVIGIRDKTPLVNITANGTTVFPSPDHKETVTLSAPDGYEAYQWSSGQTTQSIVVNKSNADSYRVKVTEPGGCESDYSLPIVVVNEGDNLTAPSNLTANTVSETQVNLFWKDNTDNETGFEIYRSTSSGQPYEFIALTDPEKVYYADKGLAPNTTYYYVVRAVNNTGASLTTQEASTATPDDLTAPSIPQNLYGMGNIDLESLTLYWDASEDNVGVTGYEVYKINADNSLTKIGDTDKNSFVVSSLVENSRHTFVVKAKDQQGHLSPASNQTSVSVQFCGVDFKLYKNSPWNSVDELREVEVNYRGHTGNFDISIINQYFPEDPNYFGFVFEGYIWITNQGNYTFTTNSDDGSKLWIDGQQVVNNDGRHGPQNREGTVNNLSPGRHKIKVAFFQASGGASLNTSYKGPDTGNNSIAIPNSVLCSTDGSILPPAAPKAPLDLAANTFSGSQINLFWSDSNTGNASYEVYRKKEDGQYILVQTLASGTETFEDTALEASTTYYYKLRAVSPMGESGFTDDEGKLMYAYYEGTWDNLPDFNAISPVKTGDINNFDISIAPKADYFAFKFDGKILIETPGSYTFYTASDDGSQLYIEGTRVVQNDFLQGHTEREGTYTFDSPGTFDISVRYFEKNGGESLDVKYAGPGISKQFIPDDVLNTGIVKATTLDDDERPTAPGSLVVESTGTTTVGLSWLPSTDNVGVVGYEIYNEQADTIIARTDAYGHILALGENGITTFGLLSTGGKKETTTAKYNLLSEEEPVMRISALVEGLTEGTDYYIYVKAIDGSGYKSDESNTEHFKTGVNQPLPIELVDFYAIAQEGYIEINWVTASEKNNDFFTLERSLDGKQFRPIGEVDGKGNSVETSYYTYEDNNPINGVQYYQLKQTDTSGEFEYSKVIRVSYNAGMGEFDLAVFPNPVTSTFYFAVKLNSSNKESPVSIGIFDMLGKKHYSAVVDAETVLNEMKISQTRLSAGIYIVSVQQADKIIKKRIIVE